MSFWAGLAKTAVSSAASGAAKAGVSAAFGGGGRSGGSSSGSTSFPAPRAKDYFDSSDNSTQPQNSRNSFDDSTKKAKTNLDRQQWLQLPEVNDGENPYELAMMWNDFLKGEK